MCCSGPVVLCPEGYWVPGSGRNHGCRATSEVASWVVFSLPLFPRSSAGPSHCLLGLAVSGLKIQRNNLQGITTWAPNSEKMEQECNVPEMGKSLPTLHMPTVNGPYSFAVLILKVARAPKVWTHSRYGCSSMCHKQLHLPQCPPSIHLLAPQDFTREH